MRGGDRDNVGSGRFVPTAKSASWQSPLLLDSPARKLLRLHDASARKTAQNVSDVLLYWELAHAALIDPLLVATWRRAPARSSACPRVTSSASPPAAKPYRYFAASASHQTSVQLVGVVGSDYPVEKLEPLKARGVDFAGLERAEGESFRWRGRYRHDLNSAETLETHLGVFSNFSPKIPAQFRSAWRRDVSRGILGRREDCPSATGRWPAP